MIQVSEIKSHISKTTSTLTEHRNRQTRVKIMVSVLDTS